MGVLLQEYSSSGSVLKLIGLIILCILIIAASFYTTKLIGRRQAGRQGKSNFVSLDVYRISQTKYLQLIQIGKRYFVIAVSKDNISVITELGREDIVCLNEPGKSQSFKDVISAIRKRNDAEVDSVVTEPTEVTESTGVTEPTEVTESAEDAEADK